MKISKIFHWLYFTVMMLPCVIIPIFAIYTRNENYNSNIEIQVEGNRVYKTTQLIKNPIPTSLSNWAVQNSNVATLSYSNEKFEVNVIGNASGWYQQGITQDGIFDSSVTHSYMFRITLESNDYTSFKFEMGNVAINLNLGFNEIKISNMTINQNRLLVYPTSLNLGTYYVSNINVFDLTQMNLVDVTTNEFDYIFNEPVYKYGIDYEVLRQNITTTYNDTDVGSQFVYTLYNATDKYFNFDNFFGLDNVYSWIQLNWFSGNAPLGFAIFWHFFTYWLLASLAWLLFDLMVYVPLYIHRWLDKGAIE